MKRLDRINHFFIGTPEENGVLNSNGSELSKVITSEVAEDIMWLIVEAEKVEVLEKKIKELTKERDVYKDIAESCCHDN